MSCGDGFCCGRPEGTISFACWGDNAHGQAAPPPGLSPLAAGSYVFGPLLDAFPGTTLEEELKARGIETVALAGFLTNCCVESTMRTAYEKGFNVITLTDCVATTSEEGQKAATTGTYGMFSSPMTSGEFKEKLA